MAKLSKTMQQCVNSMRTHGGSIERHPGGYWRCEPTGGFSFGTSTVQGLVGRGVAAYTQWQEGRNGRFPIRATLLTVPSIKLSTNE